jgi:hypothetical protein
MGVFGGLIVLGALLLQVHVWVWLRTLRAPGIPPHWRWLTWLPVVGEAVGLRFGSVVPSVLWFVVLFAYLVLRSLA